MRLFCAALVATAGVLALPSIAEAEWCPGSTGGDPPHYSSIGADAELPSSGRTDIWLKFKYLTLSHPYFHPELDPLPEDHTQGAVGVDTQWFEPSPSGGFLEAGVGIFGHRRDIPWDHPPGDGFPDPILWAAYQPPGASDLQFSWEGWAYPDTNYRFEIIRVGYNADGNPEFRIWINGFESNLTWNGGVPQPRVLPAANRVTVFGEDNSHEDDVCDDFNVGFFNLSPAMTRLNTFRPGPPYYWPWRYCHNPIGEWTNWEFWPHHRGQGYPELCNPFPSSQGRLSQQVVRN